MPAIYYFCNSFANINGAGKNTSVKWFEQDPKQDKYSECSGKIIRSLIRKRDLSQADRKMRQVHSAQNSEFAV